MTNLSNERGLNFPQKTGKISIRNLEDIYQVVGTAKDSPSARPLKDLITQIGDGAGGKLYQESRQARAKLADKFENVKFYAKSGFQVYTVFCSDPYLDF